VTREKIPKPFEASVYVSARYRTSYKLSLPAQRRTQLSPSWSIVSSIDRERGRSKECFAQLRRQGRVLLLPLDVEMSEEIAEPRRRLLVGYLYIFTGASIVPIGIGLERAVDAGKTSQD